LGFDNRNPPRQEAFALTDHSIPATAVRSISIQLGECHKAAEQQPLRAELEPKGVMERDVPREIIDQHDRSPVLPATAA
jgi:hypothetical protein